MLEFKESIQNKGVFSCPSVECIPMKLVNQKSLSDAWIKGMKNLTFSSLQKHLSTEARARSTKLNQSLRLEKYVETIREDIPTGHSILPEQKIKQLLNV